MRRKKHFWKTAADRSHTTAKKDVITDELEARQADLPNVRWHDVTVENKWQTEYLGSIFQADGDCMPDIKRRIGKAKVRAGQLRHIWATQQLDPLQLKLRLYKAAI